jgi:hypothetical protein
VLVSNGKASEGKPTSGPKDRLLTQYSILVETYRHHFDLVLKGLALYLAMVGAAAVSFSAKAPLQTGSSYWRRSS